MCLSVRGLHPSQPSESARFPGAIQVGCLPGRHPSRPPPRAPSESAAFTGAMPESAALSRRHPSQPVPSEPASFLTATACRFRSSERGVGGGVLFVAYPSQILLPNIEYEDILGGAARARGRPRRSGARTGSAGATRALRALGRRPNLKGIQLQLPQGGHRLEEQHLHRCAPYQP